MDWKNIIRTIIVVGILAGVLYIGYKKGMEEYNVFMDEYKGTDSYPGVVTTVEIPSGATIKETAGILKSAGLIKYKTAFQLRISESQYKESIQPGTYTLNDGMSTIDMIKAITFIDTGDEVLFTLTIPEGYTVEMIAAKCEKNDICTAEEFLEECNSEKYKLPFDIPEAEGRKYRLQGFLFPATYDIFESTTAESLVQAMVNKFCDVYGADYKQMANELGYSDYEIITMASMIEREALNDEERSKIASVFVNRLKEGMPLQVDPTVLYPLTDGMFDRSDVLYEDLEVASPYNTYLVSALPVGPICCPGEASILGALSPEESDNLYYRTTIYSEGALVFYNDYEAIIADAYDINATDDVEDDDDED